MYQLQTSATQSIVGQIHRHFEDALTQAKGIAHDLDIPIDIIQFEVQKRDADKVYPCGCTDDTECGEEHG